jgi:hypothetical protein
MTNLVFWNIVTCHGKMEASVMAYDKLTVSLSNGSYGQLLFGNGMGWLFSGWIGCFFWISLMSP